MGLALEDIVEEWEERAAIMEHGGELALEEAEALAWARMAEKYGDRRAAMARAVVGADLAVRAAGGG